jgi:murein DD-endopeptidase MepM/ murein hydrolase activator NlpD
VNGPGAIGFDIAEFISSQGGYLQHYEEELDGRTYTGAQVVIRVTQEYSVNPRLLLAVLEYRSGWVSRLNPDEATLEQPIVHAEAWRKGLYLQLAWAANQLNSGYYRWRVNSVSNWILTDAVAIAANPKINAGTAGVQNLFSMMFDRQEWEAAVSENGLFAVYNRLFGFPFSRSVEPLIPSNLSQPVFQLPFEPGVSWSFTGGPHGGWAEGSAWAAIDFAPPRAELGCINSDEWVVAVADGLIVRTGNGAVIQDLDTEAWGKPDGYEQTGWTVLYMHVKSQDRVEPGSYLKAGDRIGHPSCEGGYSTGTHLHLARRYNGEWIAADQDLPMVLDGWVSRGTGREYDGFLMKDGMEIEAWNGYRPESTIQR